MFCLALLICLLSVHSIVSKEYILEYNVKANWHNAQLYCRRQGMELASIENNEERDDLNKMILNLGRAQTYWIGANDLGDHGRFSWTNGNPVVYEKWASTEPNDRGSCMALGGDLLWWDEWCGRQYSFLCEKAFNIGASTTDSRQTFCIFVFYINKTLLHVVEMVKINSAEQTRFW